LVRWFFFSDYSKPIFAAEFVEMPGDLYFSHSARSINVNNDGGIFDQLQNQIVYKQVEQKF